MVSKLTVIIFGILCTAFGVLFGVVGFFVKKEIKMLNASVVELFQELREVVRKTGTYDHVVLEHNKRYGKRGEDKGAETC